MRIIAGEFRSRRLLSPPEDAPTRPIPDRVKESLFGLLRGHVEGAAVIDLFAGSGSIGLEALSRGAREVIFVERHKVAASVLRENIGILKAEDRCRVVQADALGPAALSACPRPAHLAFMDPPYDLVTTPIGLRRTLDQCARFVRLLDPGGFLMLRTEWPLRMKGEEEASLGEQDLAIDGADGPETHVYRHTAVHLYAPARAAAADDPA